MHDIGIMARGKWNDAKDVCGGGTSCATEADRDRANKLGDQASSRARLSTIFGSVPTASGCLHKSRSSYSS